MKKNSSSILIINEALNIDNQDADDDYLNIMKNDKGKKVKKFEKYKPKVANSKKDETNLEGAESKVKSLLSLFLHNIETEEKKDIDSNTLFLNEIKSKKKFTKQDKFGTTKKINIYFDRRNSNLSHKKEELNKMGTINSLNLNYIRANSLALGDKRNSIKRKKTTKKSQDKSNFYSNKRKGSLAKDNIDFNDSINFKSSIGISPNQNNNVNLIKKTKTNSLEICGKNNLKKLKSISINYSPIKKSIKIRPLQKFSTMKIEKEFSENKLKKKLRSSLKIPNKKKNSISRNESCGDSILSDNSKIILKKLTEYKNDLKIEDQLKDSSLIVKNLEESDMGSSYINKNKTSSIIRNSNISINKKDENSSISKNSSINISNNSNKNSLIGSIVRKKRRILTNKGSHGLMRAITTSVGKHKGLFKSETNKLFRVETALKSLQEQIKQTIILRPEDLVLDLSEGVKPSIKKEKTNVGKEKKEKKEANKNLSSQSIFSKKNELDVLKKSDVKKVEDIPIVIQNVDKNQEEAYNAGSNDLLKNETEEELQEDLSKTKIIHLHEKYRVFIHRNQVYDSLDDEEIEDEVSNYIYFSPDSKLILIFDAILLFFTLYSIFWIPFYLAHNLNFCNEIKFQFRTALNLFIEFINFLDLVFSFFKAYYNFEEQLIKKNSTIAKKYLSGWFTIDLISAIPFYSIFKFREKKCNSLDLSIIYYDNVLHNLNYLYMYNRILKIIKVYFTNQAYNYLSNNYQEKRPFLKLLIYLIRMSCLLCAFHFCACLYIFIGRNSYPNWILYTKLEIKSFADIYVCAIYMLITTLTTVGYGDITCYSFAERIFQLFLLIIGIMSYSFAVSSFSNYVQKINEKSVEYEKRKKILDDIKLSNPNLPDNLYDRIIRYLKYKNLSEKRDKNIILDCLPVGLKNDLIYEMYKPIIQNFIFFKNFENTDFIVRVILCFRPIIAIKNDILVNEGEIVEDIMFVKKGVLSVELPININDPQENEKYLNMTILKIEKGPDLEKIGNTTIINTNMNSTNILGKIAMPGEDVEKKMNKTKTDNKKKYEETTYVKILNIRENEHFGDVLMFLEKRSPLRVRVRSKKAELFFLKKTDAVKISSSYQNIWRRINKKSVYNFEQIKKSIHKIVEIYCAFNTMKTLSDNDENNENIKLRKTYRKTMRISKRKLKLEPETNARRSKSEKKILNEKSKYFDDNIKETKISRNKSFEKPSTKIPNLNPSSLSEDSDSDDSDDSDDSESKEYSSKINNLSRNKKRTNSRLFNAYNRQYKYYKGANNKGNLDIIDSIIDEEPGNEDTITPLRKKEGSTFNKTSSIKYNNLNKTSSIKYNLNKTSSIKYNLDKTPSLKYNNLNKTSSIKHDFKSSASIKQGLEKSNSSKVCVEKNSKSNLDNCSHYIKCIKEKEEFEEEEKEDSYFSSNSSNDKKRKNIKEEEIRICGKSKFNKNAIYSSSDSDKNNIISEPNIPSLSFNKNLCSNEVNNINEVNENDLTPFKKEDINEEIYPNEIFNISKKEENLFSRKIKPSNVLNQIQNYPNNFIPNNDKIQFLLDSDKGKSINNQNNINQIQIINNNIENINTNININKDTSEIKINTTNLSPCKCHTNAVNSSLSKAKTMLLYSIIKNTEIEYKSLYENLNQITNYKYSNNTELQNKVRNMITESSIISSATSNTNNVFKKYSVNTFKKNPTYNSNKQKFVNTINPLTKKKNSFSLCHINSITNQKLNELNNNIKKHKSRKRNIPLTKRSETYSDSPEPKMMRSPSIDYFKPRKNKFQTGIGISLNNNLSFAGKFGIRAQKSLRIKNEFEKQKTSNNENIVMKKTKGEKTEFPIVSGFLGGIEQKNTIGMSPNLFRKKKGNLLSQINLNIEKTNQNLNNPEEFYTNYFNSILGGSEQPKFEIKRAKRRSSAICFSNKMLMPSPTKNFKNKKKK